MTFRKLWSSLLTFWLANQFENDLVGCLKNETRAFGYEARSNVSPFDCRSSFHKLLLPCVLLSFTIVNLLSPSYIMITSNRNNSVSLQSQRHSKSSVNRRALEVSSLKQSFHVVKRINTNHSPSFWNSGRFQQQGLFSSIIMFGAFFVGLVLSFDQRVLASQTCSQQWYFWLRRRHLQEFPCKRMPH